MCKTFSRSNADTCPAGISTESPPSQISLFSLHSGAVLSAFTWISQHPYKSGIMINTPGEETASGG